jgi:predicted transcriptional regulator
MAQHDVEAVLGRIERSVRELIKGERRKLAPRGNGRPRALGEGDLTAAKAMLRGDPSITVEEVARILRVGPATIYRHLPGGRSSLA